MIDVKMVYIDLLNIASDSNFSLLLENYEHLASKQWLNLIPGLGSIAIDCVISKPCNRGTILLRNYRKMIIYGHFPIILL